MIIVLNGSQQGSTVKEPEPQPAASPEPSKGRRGRGPLSFAAAALVAAVIGYGAGQLRLPYLVAEPGPARNVATLTDIDTETYPSKGAFFLTTALFSDTRGVNIPSAIGAVFDDTKTLVERESVFPSDVSRTDADRLHAAQMMESQIEAAAAALAELGVDTMAAGAFVRAVGGDVPAEKELLPGDIITFIDEVSVSTIQDLTGYLDEEVTPGDDVDLRISRGESDVELTVKTVESEQGDKAALGILVVQNRHLPFEVAIDSEGIGGPSAGLIFALQIYDSLTEDDLTAGRVIAGTGTISNLPDQPGVVGPVGGIAQKMEAAKSAGARIFLVPEADAGEAQSKAEPPMRVIAVSTLHEAIKALAAG